MNHEPLKNVTESIQAIVTSTALIVGGIWAFLRFRRTREGKPLIEPSLDVIFVRRQNARWIVEIIASFENKGKARLEITKFRLELRYSLASDKIGAGTILIPDVFQSQKEIPFQSIWS